MRRALLVWFLLSSQLLLGIAGPSWILCRESSGEVTLEWGLAGCCEADDASSAAAEVSWSASDDGCGTCTDGTLVIPLRCDDARLAPPLAPPAVGWWPALPAAPLARPRPVEPPRPPPGLAARSTVVIRC